MRLRFLRERERRSQMSAWVVYGQAVNLATDARLRASPDTRPGRARRHIYDPSACTTLSEIRHFLLQADKHCGVLLLGRC